MTDPTKKIYRCESCGRRFFFKENYDGHCAQRIRLGGCPVLPKPPKQKKRKKKTVESRLTLEDVEHFT